MTRNSALKKQVRARMAATGENYTTALRALTADARSPVAQALQPGTVTLAINGGGQLNAALFAAELARLARAGHQLILAPLAQGGSIELPHLIDLLVAGNTVSEKAAPSQWNDIQALGSATATAFPQKVLRLTGALPFSALQQELQNSLEATGKPPVLYVQDVQEAGAVLIAHARSEALQVARLGELARVTTAIVAAGHCMSAEMEESWQLAADAASTTFAIEDDRSSDDVRQATLRRFLAGDPIDEFDCTIDLRPFAWRRELYRRESAAR